MNREELIEKLAEHRCKRIIQDWPSYAESYKNSYKQGISADLDFIHSLGLSVGEVKPVVWPEIPSAGVFLHVETIISETKEHNPSLCNFEEVSSGN
jgi:hypothetical protein